MLILLEIAIAWLYSHFFEWFVHKKFLHNKNRRFAFKNHFGNHHRISRKNFMIDDFTSRSTLNFEKKYLILAVVLHLPLVFLFPYAFITLILCAITYYIIHKQAHRDMRWARRNVPWHYEHHLGIDQNCNWGVRLPIVDIIMGTRKHFINTPQEKRMYIIAYRKFYMEKINETRSRSTSGKQP